MTHAKNDNRAIEVIIFMIGMILGAVLAGATVAALKHSEGFQAGWAKYRELQSHFPLGHCSSCNKHTDDTCPSCHWLTCNGCRVDDSYCKNCSPQLAPLRAEIKQIEQRHEDEIVPLYDKLEEVTKQLRDSSRPVYHRDLEKER